MRGAWYDFGGPACTSAPRSRCSPGLSRPARVPSSTRGPGASARGVTRSVVGPKTVVEEGAEVVGSILWDRVRVGSGARVRGSILDTGSRVESRGQVEGQVMVPTGRLRGAAAPGRTRRGHRLVEVG